MVYLVLAIQQRIACWVAAFVSSCLYVWVLFGAHLYMESALNAFYAAMAVYGFWQWQHGAGGARSRRDPLAGRRAMPRASSASALVAGELVFSAALHPGRVAVPRFAGDLVQRIRHLSGGAQSVRELALVAGDRFGQSVPVFYTRHCICTMLLFALYLVLIVIGMREWRRDLPLPAAMRPRELERARCAPRAGQRENRDPSL